jgi:two-component system, NtrC family, sensor kinase
VPVSEREYGCDWLARRLRPLRQFATCADAAAGLTSPGVLVILNRMASQPSSAEQAELPAVLIVDDAEANLVVLRSLLEGLQCRVTSVTSGSQALLALLRQEFAVMLLDVQMPDIDGYEVAQHARMNPKTRDVPIIFLTAALESGDHLKRGYGSGAVDFLFKPIDPAMLLGKVRVFLELYSSRQKLASANRELARKNAELVAFVEAEAAISTNLRKANDELQAAYHELQATQGQLVQAAKMASLGELVAGVAHEINNPLAFVMSHLETAEKCLTRFRLDLPGEVPARAEEQWQRAKSRLTETQLGLGRIRDLVVKLRTFSRLDEGERKSVSISECVESVVTILEHRLKDRIAIAVDLRPPDVLECYPSLLNQVLLNLVANSIDAIEGPGTIQITAGAEGDTFVISVTDNGPGIPADVRDRVLEPFFTTKPVGQGTGLGLSIAYSIIKKHDGTFDLSDAPGGGTLATVRVPIQPKQS